MFTDFYGQQSCTAGRAAFITGQSPIRTGLTKVGCPARRWGSASKIRSVGKFMKNFGYATGQFGKNHLGDRNEHLPTVHGFDEFFGNLYHLNAEEEPEYENYPKDPAFRKKFGPRGVLKCKATDKDDPTVDAQFGKVGKQTIREHRSAPKKRMETVDEEFIGAALDFIDRKTKAGAPWFCYFNPTRMHVFTHLKPASKGKTGLGLYPDGMVELDGYVGQLLEEDRRSRRSRTTPSSCSPPTTAPKCCPGPTAAQRRSAARKTPTGKAAGECRASCAGQGHRARPRHQRHLLAAGLHPDLRGRERRARSRREGEEGLRDRRQERTKSISTASTCCRSSPARRRNRRARASFTGATTATAWRCAWGEFKIVFAEQRSKGLDVWREPLSPMRIPKFFDLRADPFERGEESFKYNDWFCENIFLQYAAPPYLMQWLESFKEFPPRRRPRASASTR